MIYPITYKHDENQKVFFFSDFHFNHDRDFIWGRRGFANVQESNIELVGRWNKKISENDIVFHLGDIAFGKDAIVVLQNLLNRLRFKELYLLQGNHYAGLKQMFDTFFMGGIDKYWRITSKISDYKTIYIVPNYYELYINGQPIVLSHYPMKCWNGHAHGSWCLCGHTHASYKDSLPDTLDSGKILDLSPEAVKEPLNFDEIKIIMDKKTITQESHHTGKSSSPFGESSK